MLKRKHLPKFVVANKLSLANRLTLIIGLIFAASFGSMTWYIQRFQSSHTEEVLSERLQHIAATASVAVDTALYEDLAKTVLSGSQDQSPAFQSIATALKRIQNENQLSSDVYILALPKPDSETMTFVAMSAESPYIGNSQSTTELIRGVYKTGKPASSGVYQTENGTWISGAAPIFDKSGKVIGAIEADYDVTKDLAEERRRTFISLIMPMLGVGAFVTIVIRAQARRIADQIRAGNQVLIDQIKLIADLSGSLRDTNSELNMTAEAQQDRFQQVQDSNLESTQLIRTNFSSAGQARERMQASADAVSDGLKSLLEVIEAIKSIQSSHVESSERLSAKATEISQISDLISTIAEKTKVINSIVTQTRILSFNASLEAARAGELGKGFSVVASEIGELAGVSGTAATQIDFILNSSRDQANRLIGSFTEEVNRSSSNVSSTIRTGVNCSKICETKFNLIGTEINEARKNVIEISDRSEDHDRLMSKVEAHMTELSIAFEQNQEIARATMTVSEQVEACISEIETISDAIKELIDGKESFNRDIRTLET